MLYKCSGDQYIYAEKMVQLYRKLQDEQSKEIFWARLRFETEPNINRSFQLGETGRNQEDIKPVTNIWKEEVKRVRAAGKKIVLYGAGAYGKEISYLIRQSGDDFEAFCDQGKKGEIFCGKPVLSPEEVINHSERYAVIISTATYRLEILNYLHKNSFPMDSVFYSFRSPDWPPEKSDYFEFLDWFEPGSAFVDAGCFDGSDSIEFSQRSHGMYSKIYAFEPDEKNYCRCIERIKTAGLLNVEFFQAGLSKISGEAAFAAAADGGSCLIEAEHPKYNIFRPDTGNTTIKTFALDDLADDKIGMIKMDIEGAELDALYGAKGIIQRDKPLLAVCVYHRRGDMLAIMDFLYGLVPEYRFWLRHYSATDIETVLYAII